MNSLVALPIVAATPTTAPAMPTSVDPIFAALDAFQLADAQFYADGSGDIPNEVGDRWTAAVDRVLETRPTTPAGLAALTSFARDVAGRSERGDASFGDRQWVPAIVAIDTAARDMSGLQSWTPPKEPAVHPDAELCAAVDRYLAALSEYAAAALVFDEVHLKNPKPRGYLSKERAYHRAMNRFGKMERELSSMRPKTLGGLMAKASALEADRNVSDQLRDSILGDLINMVPTRERLPNSKRLLDQELIALGAEFEASLADEQPLKKEADRLYEAADRLRYKRMGVDPDDKEACDCAAKTRWSDWSNIRTETGGAVGYDQAYNAWNEASEKTARVGEKILRIKAETAQGLLIKARVIETHDEVGDSEPDEQLLAEIKKFATHKSS